MIGNDAAAGQEIMITMSIGIILKNQKIFHEKIIIFYTQFSNMTNVMK